MPKKLRKGRVYFRSTEAPRLQSLLQHARGSSGKFAKQNNMAEYDKVCYADSLENALGIVQDYELRTTTKFTIYKKSKAFGNTGSLT